MNIHFLEVIAILSVSSSLLTSIALCYYCKNIKKYNNIILEEVILNNTRTLDDTSYEETSL